MRVLICAALSISLCFISCSTVSSPNGDVKAVYALRPLERKALRPDEGVYYCIFVRSFADSDGDGIGDFQGLIKKLDYLNDGDDKTTDDLGITGIWLMPIFPSHSYHGYDVDDYYTVNSEYGTLADFDRFMDEARKRGISVILDITFNHSSVHHPWFTASRSPDSQYRDWYRWTDGSGDSYNPKQKIWGHNVWNQTDTGYYAALFDSSMPDFNLDNKELRTELKKVTDFWMDRGVSGFRFDAASHVYNRAELPRGEEGQTKALDFWKDISTHIRQKHNNAYSVAEVWETASARALYVSALPSVFHFDLGTMITDTLRSGSAGKNNLAHVIAGTHRMYKASNPNYIDAPFLTNHDQNRIGGILKNDPALLKLAAAVYVLGEGVPFIYYGEELGLNGAKPDEQIRTPMLWNIEGKDSAQTFWIKSKYNKNTFSAAEQKRDPESVLQYYKRLIRLRTSLPALYRGRMEPYDTGNMAILSWTIGSDSDGRLLVIHNVSDSPVVLEGLLGESAEPVFAGHRSVRVVKHKNGVSLSIPPRSSVVLANYKK